MATDRCRSRALLKQTSAGRMATLAISLLVLTTASAQSDSYELQVENMKLLIEIFKHFWEAQQDFGEEVDIVSEMEENCIENTPIMYNKVINIPKMNIWADHFIENVTNKIHSTDNEYIEVPNLKEEISEHRQSIPVQLGMLTSEGVLGELSSLRRAGDTSVFIRDTEVFVEIPLVLNRLGVNFEYCKIWYGSIKVTDEIEVIVPIYEKTPLRTRIVLNTEDGQCTASLDYLEIEIFKNLDIIFSDFCLSRNSEPIYSWVTNYFNVVVRQVLERKLSHFFSKQLTQFDICLVLK